MAVKYTKPKGTLDVLPGDSWKWLAVEKKIRDVARLYGYKEIRLPTFENTEVFSRGVGETTDIVSKEMYTFMDKGNRSVTLRPEGTAGVVRAVLENGLLSSSPLPLKSYYLQSCFRYENSQKGRYREFHQFGIECFGTHAPASDVEVMLVAAGILNRLGIMEKVSLEINSIGCPDCRPAYHKKLTAYYEQYRDRLCPTCLQRLETNPLRLLDCKEKECSEIASKAPVMLDYLCENCDEHFNETKKLLDESCVDYIINPYIVRGLDYYTNTVFEFIASGIGTQGTVCAGGRYNGLIEQFGGAPTPAVGFGMGLERLIMLLEQYEKLPSPPHGPFFYAVAACDAGRTIAHRLAQSLRFEGIAAECDVAQRSLKAQMKAAGRLGALYVMVIGDEEIESGIAKFKRMSDGAEAEIPMAVTVTALKFLFSQDPQAESCYDLQDLVESIGPTVIFNEE